MGVLARVDAYVACAPAWARSLSVKGRQVKCELAARAGAIFGAARADVGLRCELPR